MAAVELHARYPSLVAPGTQRPLVRFLTPNDLPELQRVEAEKWDAGQAASPQDLALRIELYPGLSLAAFHPLTGKMLASLFLRPIADDFWKHIKNWRECVDGPIPLQTSALFGISLSSVDPAAVDTLLEFFWPHALAGGWRHIYLGSPLPGWSAWRQAKPGRSILDYVRETRRGLPVDPQLRYYKARGFKKIVCLKRDYFRHERSQDHGAIVRGTVPLSALSVVWQGLRPEQVRRITGPLSSVML